MFVHGREDSYAYCMVGMFCWLYGGIVTNVVF